MKKKNDWVFSQAKQIVLEQVELPFGGKWTFEVTKEGELFVTNETVIPLTFRLNLNTITLHSEDKDA